MNDTLVTSMDIDTSGIDSLFARMEELSGKGAGEIIRQRAGLFGRTLAAYTQPVAGASGGAISGSEDASGFSEQARELGRAAVRRDVARVYVGIGRVVNELKRRVGERAAKAFVALLRKDREAALKLLAKSGIQGTALVAIDWDDGKRHRTARNSRGRVSTGIRPFIVLDQRALAAFIKKKEGNVGFAKSSFISAAAQIPNAQGLGKQVPAWVKKHRAPGSGIDKTRTDGNPHIILRSGLPWMDRVLRPETMRRVEMIFATLLEKDLEHAIKALEAKAASQARAA